ncbi:MAG: VOC family protein [Planctomycetota bacterium]
MKFGYTILYVTDVEKSVAFYEAAFGLNRKFIHEAGYAEMNTGQTTLAFANLKVAEGNGVSLLEPSPAGPAHAFEVALVTDDVATSFARAVHAGAVVVADPKAKPWGQTVAYVRDINGFLVEICSPVEE